MGPEDPIFAAARERRSSLETVSLAGSSQEDLLAFFGISSGKAQLPAVTIETALSVPAVGGSVHFLARTLANLPLHTYRKKGNQAERSDGDLQMLLNEAPNPEWSSYRWRKYMWTQVFTGGRGLTYIERAGSKVVALWPMDPAKVTLKRQGGRTVYRFERKEYSADQVIDIPFLLKSNQLNHWSPIFMAKRAIALMLAMEEHAGTHFAGGGVPPLALQGPMPQGADGFRRAQEQISRAIDLAKKNGTNFFGMPPGHELKAIGIDPHKSQLVEGRLFQVQEWARMIGLPTVFVQDLSTGTFANTEHQDLQLVKHLIAHWAKDLEDEVNLKVHGQRRRASYVEHSLDAIQRGDFKTRIEAYARGIQTGQLMPDEARALENRAPAPGGNRLYIQGATVPIEMAGKVQVKAPANDKKEEDGDANAE